MMTLCTTPIKSLMALFYLEGVLNTRVEKQVKGIVYGIVFVLMGLSFLFEPNTGIIVELEQFGLHQNFWVISFILSGFGAFVQGLAHHQWNAIVFAPILTYVGALFAMRFIHLIDTPLTTVVIHVAFAVLVTIDLVRDWTDGTNN